jgi:hypothetical protein
MSDHPIGNFFVKTIPIKYENNRYNISEYFFGHNNIKDNEDLINEVDKYVHDKNM